MRARVNAIPHEGFWRLGRRWPCAGVEVDLSEADLAILQAEPRLQVVRLEEAPPETESPEEPEHATEAAPSAPNIERESDTEPATPKGGKGRKK